MPHELLLRASEGGRLSLEDYLELYEYLKRNPPPPEFRPRVVTYSRKVFIPLTNLCRDSCGYCTFVKKPWEAGAKTYTLDEVLEVARRGERLGCKEALFSLGDKPELAHPEYAQKLRAMGYRSTFEYLLHACYEVCEKTGLIPHANPGTLSWSQMKELRRACGSMGLMLESASERLMGEGMAHEGCPDKHPRARLAMIRAAGNLRIPFTTGILVGIGETVEERIESLLALRSIQEEFGHIQEVIIQNFRPKPGTRMAGFGEPSVEDYLATIALAKLILGGLTAIQAPPNLARTSLSSYFERGVCDLGGISPLTIDYINPEAPWPHLARLKAQIEAEGYVFRERLCVHPRYIREDGWVDGAMLGKIKVYVGEDGLVRPEWEAF